MLEALVTIICVVAVKLFVVDDKDFYGFIVR